MEIWVESPVIGQHTYTRPAACCLLSPCLLFDVASLGVQKLGHFWINMIKDTSSPVTSNTRRLTAIARPMEAKSVRTHLAFPSIDYLVDVPDPFRRA